MNLSGKSYINGQWVEGQGSSWERRSPSDNNVTWSGQFCQPQQAEQAIEAAHDAFENWSMLPLEDRIACCQQFAEKVTAKKTELAKLIAVETGKPVWEAGTEVAASIGKVANSIEAIQQRRWTTTQTLGDFNAVTRFRAHGVMFVIGPFNFPAHVPGGHIIPALLAGNTVVFKPSEWVPAVGEWLTNIWADCGLPAGVFNLLQGQGDVGAVATSHDDVAGVLFTGSAKVGQILHKALAGRPEKVLALELGGNNPLVVHNASNVKAAAKTIILSAFLTSGQRCTCTRRLIVSGQQMYDAVIAELQTLIPQIRVGLSLDDPQPFMGPLIHPQAATQMVRAQEELLAAGATSLVPLQRDERSDSLVTPGLISLSKDHPHDDCENFGPLLTVQMAEDLPSAVAMANDTKFGLSAGFIGDSQEDFQYFLNRIQAGVVNWNRQTTGASGKLPFGGVGLSGNHQPSGSFAADYCSFPIASLESSTLSEATKPVQGLDFEVSL